MGANVEKEVVVEEINKIMFGIKLKDVDTIMKELEGLKKVVAEYREPYKCDTCRKRFCDAKRYGFKNCSAWEQNPVIVKSDGPC